jgi:hypothetical protein
MLRPINQFRDYPIEDYQALPNCLEVFAACCAIAFDGKTTDQYKTAVSAVARKPCRVVLKLVDVSADYDYGTFELLRDDATSALESLKEAGDLGEYSRYLKEPLSINCTFRDSLTFRRRG